MSEHRKREGDRRRRPKERLASVAQRQGLALLLVTCALLTAVWAIQDFASYRTDIAAIRQDCLESRRGIIRHQVDRAIEFIEFERAAQRKRIEKQLKMKVDEAHHIASYLYERNRDKSPAELESIIHDALFCMRWTEGDGYYFVVDDQGIIKVHPLIPELEGQASLGLCDPEGTPLIRNMLHIGTEHGAGYTSYKWRKSSTTDVHSPKLSYVRVFEPLGWIIGTGQYLDEIEFEIQDIVKERLGAVRYEDGEGYIFINSYDGIQVLNPTHPERGRPERVGARRCQREAVRSGTHQQLHADRRAGSFVMHGASPAAAKRSRSCRTRAASTTGSGPSGRASTSTAWTGSSPRGATN
jgi:hypothetical protein